MNDKTNIILENYIRRMTNGGQVIGNARYTIMPIRQGMPHLAWIHSVANKFLFEIEPGSGTPVQARIEWGRWCVQCPNCHQGFEDVSPEEKVFFCFTCGWENKIHPVEFPDNIAEVEQVLLKRSQVRNRNWTDESLSQLRRENIQHAEAV